MLKILVFRLVWPKSMIAKIMMLKLVRALSLRLAAAKNIHWRPQEIIFFLQSETLNRSALPGNCPVCASS